MTNVEIAWVAGIIEGEGYIGIHERGNKAGISVRVSMTDLDIIERLQSTTGVGRIHALKQNHPGWKPAWTWSVQKHRDVIYVLTAIAPLMGERRRSRIGMVVEKISETWHRECPHCHVVFMKQGKAKWMLYCSKLCKRRAQEVRRKAREAAA